MGVFLVSLLCKGTLTFRVLTVQKRRDKVEKYLKQWQAWVLTILVTVVSLMAEAGLILAFAVTIGGDVPLWLSISISVGALGWLLSWCSGLYATRNWLTTTALVVAMPLMGASWVLFLIVSLFWWQSIFLAFVWVAFSSLAVWLVIEDPMPGISRHEKAETLLVWVATRVVPVAMIALIVVICTFVLLAL